MSEKNKEQDEDSSLESATAKDKLEKSIHVKAPPAVDPLPKGRKNYMTPGGAKELREELLYLNDKVRPELLEVIAWAAGNGDRSENGDYIYGRKRLREIDKRLRYLTKRIDNLEVVDPETQSGEKILFGATVTLLDEEEKERKYSIVGVDESDIKKGKISWISPIAKSLMQKMIGDIVVLKSPGGEKEFEITGISYKQIP